MQPVLKFNVRNQNISRMDTFLPVRYSRNYLYAEFDFKTCDWNEKTKTAIFSGTGLEPIPVILGETDTCLVPWEVLECTEFTVTVHAGDLITVDSAKVKLYESGYRPGDVPEPTQDVYQQLINMLTDQVDGLSYTDNILSLMAGEKNIASVTITGGSGSGTDGREVELQNDGTHIQWRYVGEESWTNLIALEDIKGPAGPAGEKGDPGTITPEQISEALEEYFASNPIEETDPTVPQWAKEPTKPSYTAEEVGALPNDTKIPTVATETESGTMYPNSSYFLVGADGKLSPKILEELTDDTNSIKFVTAKAVVDYAKSKVSSHNTATDSHNDIRLLIQNLVNTVTALLDSDDETLDQTSEIVAYVKSNKSLIDAITTSKVSVTDIIDNLTTNVANKPLSASQGVALKGLIDALQTELDGIVIPTKLPNPNSLKIVYGGQEYNYDGSSAIEITIDTGKVDRIEKLSTDTTVELEPNKLYVFPEMSELTITFAEPSDITAVSEYHFLFQSGATATTLTLPDTVKLPSGFSVDANKVYEISILEGCLCCQSWEVDASA